MTRTLFKDSRRPYFWCERALLELGLTTDAVAVYCLLAARANETDQCWPSYTRIASQLGISRRTAIRAVGTLCRRGLLRKRTVRREGSKARINLYELMDIPLDAKGGVPESPTGASQSPIGDCQGTPLVTPEHQERGTIERGKERDQSDSEKTRPADQVHSLSDTQLQEELRAGTATGRLAFRNLVGALAPDAQARRLIYDGFAKDEDDARHIITACTGST